MAWHAHQARHCNYFGKNLYNTWNGPFTLNPSNVHPHCNCYIIHHDKKLSLHASYAGIHLYKQFLLLFVWKKKKTKQQTKPGWSWVMIIKIYNFGGLFCSWFYSIRTDTASYLGHLLAAGYLEFPGEGTWEGNGGSPFRSVLVLGCSCSLTIWVLSFVINSGYGSNVDL